MSLAKNLLAKLNVSNHSIDESLDINEAKKSNDEPMSVQEYFSVNFNDVSFCQVTLDESTDEELYVDTEIESMPVSFRFYVENEIPKLDILSYNESTDESLEETIKLSKRMLDSEGNLLIEENLKHMPTDKIQEAVEKISFKNELMKTVTRKINGAIKKMKVAVSLADIRKARKSAQLYRKANKQKLKMYAKKYAKKIDSVGLNASKLMDINKRRKLKGLAPVDKSGKEVV